MKGGCCFRVIKDNTWSPDVRISEMKKTGVDVQVLSTVPIMFNYHIKPKDSLDLCTIVNNDLANTRDKYPKNFMCVGTLPMQDAKLAIKELTRIMTKLNFRGIMIGSHINDKTLDHEKFFPIFKKCEELGACIFVHPWDMMGMKLMKKYWLPWLVSMPAETTMAIASFVSGGIFERLPKLRVCFAHGGGAYPFTIGRFERGWECRPDLCAVDNKKNPREYLGRFWVDSLVHDELALEYLVKVCKKDKVILGSDYPFPLGEPFPGEMVNNADLDEKTKEKIFVQNALDFLDADKSNFKELDHTELEEHLMDCEKDNHEMCGLSNIHKDLSLGIVTEG